MPISDTMKQVPRQFVLFIIQIKFHQKLSCYFNVYSSRNRTNNDFLMAYLAHKNFRILFTKNDLFIVDHGSYNKIIIIDV